MLLEKRLDQNMSMEMFTYMDEHIHAGKCLHVVYMHTVVFAIKMGM